MKAMKKNTRCMGASIWKASEMTTWKIDIYAVGYFCFSSQRAMILALLLLKAAINWVDSHLSLFIRALVVHFHHIPSGCLFHDNSV